jgi:phospholipase A1/A2
MLVKKGKNMKIYRLILVLLAPVPAFAQTAATATVNAPAAPDWAQCSALTSDNTARLACFDRWAQDQQQRTSVPPATATTASPVTIAATQTLEAAVAAKAFLRPCTDPKQSELSRFWELETGSDCGTFGIRGYRPISLSWIGSDSVNTAPSSPSAGHTASYTAYRTSEARIQLSVRTKIARGLLTESESGRNDSLWFGYSQQSYWQLFNGAISRPFRATDHEPEITYIYPTDAQLSGGWRLRYSGISAVHQSNGQSLPLSRSWNRVVLMAGMEKGDDFRVMARAWARLPESSEKDDNPDISNYVGRAEVAGFWNVNKDNTLGITLRHSLRTKARGSVRLEWLQTLGGNNANGDYSGLRFHTQLFSGYGDSLVDYNRRRTVLSLGLSLVDF